MKLWLVCEAESNKLPQGETLRNEEWVFVVRANSGKEAINLVRGAFSRYGSPKAFELPVSGGEEVVTSLTGPMAEWFEDND
jgi:hypothetical protein